MSIFTGQKIPFCTEFTEINCETGETEIVNLTGATIRYDYWLPGTVVGDPPSGFATGQVDGDPLLGRASGFIPAAENTVAGDTWRSQAIAIIGGDEWPAGTLQFEVFKRGTSGR